MKKRLVTLALALTMALSLLPAAALAAEGTVDVGPANLYYAITERSASLRMYPTADHDQNGNAAYGYMDEQGRWALPPTYQQAGNFFDSGYAHVVTRQGQGYIINTDGELLLSVGSYQVMDVIGGNVWVAYERRDGVRFDGVLSLTGKLIAPLRENAEISFPENGKYVIQKISDGMNDQGNVLEGQAWIYDAATGKDLFPDQKYTNIKVLSSDRLVLATGHAGANDVGYSQCTLADFSGRRYPLSAALQKRAMELEPFAANGLSLATYWYLRPGQTLMAYFVFLDKNGKEVISEQQAEFVTSFLPNGSYYRRAAGQAGVTRYDAKGKSLGTIPTDGLSVLCSGGLLYGWDGICYSPDGRPLSVPADFGEIDQEPDSREELIFYHDESIDRTGVMSKTGQSLVPLSKGTMYRAGDYIVHLAKLSDNSPPKYYDLTGKLVATIPPETSNGRIPLVSGGRTVYAPSSARGVGMAPPARVVTLAAAPSSTKLTVNGTAASVDAYLIDNSNYMKLRDLAALLSGTGKQFEVTYDSAKGAVNMFTGKPYTTVGGELAPGDGKTKTATTGTAPLYIDGKGVHLKAYAIGGNHFYKLRDVMQAVNVSVGWGSAGVTLDTAAGYTVDAPAAGLYTIRTSLDVPKNVDVSQGSTAPGAHIITWDKSGEPNQSFALQKVGGKYRILAAHSGLALSAGGGEQNVQLVQAPVADDQNQLFTLLRQPSGGYNLVAANGQYVGVSAGSTDNGTPLILWEKTGSKSQEFIFG